MERLILSILLFALAQIVYAQEEGPAISCDLVRDAVKASSQIRKLAVKSAVPCLVRDKQQIREFMLDTIRTQLPPQKLQNEGRLFEALGLIPRGFDYAKQLVELYVNQVGGYYDPHQHHYVMARWMPASVQMTIAVHELTHALQDQHFNLEHFMDPKLENSDEQLARSALVEGDATAVMTDYSRRLAGMSGIATLPDVNSLLLQNALGIGLLGGSEIPQSLKLLLLFPYSSGLRFVHEILKQGDYAAVDKVFNDPPKSSSEILHPEEYRTRANRKVSISEQELNLPSGSTIIYQDTVGEFVISALLSNFLLDGSLVAKAAAGWQADRAVLYTQPGSDKVRTVWVSRWQNDQQAQEFCEAYKQAISVMEKNDPKSAVQRKFSCSGAFARLIVED